MRRRRKETSESRRRRHDKYYKPTAIYKRRKWTAREETVLAYWTGTDKELSPVIRRSICSIEHKRRRLREDGVKLRRDSL